MKHAMIATLLAASLAGELAADCPPPADRTDELLGLFAEARKAPNAAVAQPINSRMWDIWFSAPDEIAQEILNRGLQRRAGYDFAGALADFEALIAYCPDYAEGYNQRAFLRFIRQEYELALDDLEQAILLSPNHMGAQTGRALTLFGLGRDAEGQAVLRAALQIHPWLPERRLLKAPEDPEDAL